MKIRLATKSLSNNYKRTFKDPGLYYFQTDSKNPDVKHLCLVEVHQSFKDHSVEIFDNKFSPTRITVEEGDRVFFSWNKDTCQKRHCIYQIETPLPDHKPGDAYFVIYLKYKFILLTKFLILNVLNIPI